MLHISPVQPMAHWPPLAPHHPVSALPHRVAQPWAPIAPSSHTALCDGHCVHWTQGMGTHMAVLAPVMANDSVHCDALAKHSPVSSKKYALCFLFRYRNLRRGFKIAEKINFFCIFVIPFSVDINTLPLIFQTECIELQVDVQLKRKMWSCLFTGLPLDLS